MTDAAELSELSAPPPSTPRASHALSQVNQLPPPPAPLCLYVCVFVCVRINRLTHGDPGVQAEHLHQHIVQHHRNQSHENIRQAHVKHNGRP